MAGFDLKQVSRNDKGIVGAGIVAFIASFLPYYGGSVSISGFHASSSISAWHSYAILGLLLMFAGAAIVAARVFGGVAMPKLPVGVNVLVAGLAALGTLLVILRGFTADSGSGAGYSYGVQWGGYILMIAGVIETVFAVMNFRESGEKLAWDSSAINHAPAQAPVAPQASAPVSPVTPAAEAPVTYPPNDSTPSS